RSSSRFFCFLSMRGSARSRSMRRRFPIGASFGWESKGSLMNGNGAANFVYLNRENRWADFELSKMEVGPDGTLTLAGLPALAGQPLPGARDLPAPTAPAGLAAASDGTLYVSDPDGDRLLVIDPCDGTLAPSPCVGGRGDRPGQLRTPRGVVYHPIRQRVFLVDNPNPPIPIFHPKSLPPPTL